MAGGSRRRNGKEGCLKSVIYATAEKLRTLEKKRKEAGRSCKVIESKETESQQNMLPFL